MTCIVGLKTDRGILMGGDSASVSGWTLNLTAEPKVFHNGPYLIGCSGFPRMHQLLQFSELPEPPVDDHYLMKFMVTTFANAIRQIFKDAGFAKKENEAEEGGCFLIGVQGHLFQIQSNYQVIERATDYDSIGCGEEIARGSLWTTGEQGWVEPYKRVAIALSAAEAHSAGVQGPFHIEMQMNRDQDGN